MLARPRSAAGQPSPTQPRTPRRSCAAVLIVCVCAMPMYSVITTCSEDQHELEEEQVFRVRVMVVLT